MSLLKVFTSLQLIKNKGDSVSLETAEIQDTSLTFVVELLRPLLEALYATSIALEDSEGRPISEDSCLWRAREVFSVAPELRTSSADSAANLHLLEFSYKQFISLALLKKVTLENSEGAKSIQLIVADPAAVANCRETFRLQLPLLSNEGGEGTLSSHG